MITVGDLKKMLKRFEDNRVIVLSCDAEGNNFSPLSEGFYWGGYNDEYGSIGPLTLEEAEEEGIDAEDLMDGVPCLVFYPT